MSDLPEVYVRLRSAYPQIADAYDTLGDAIHQAGPLDDKTRQLVKLAFAIGAGLEGATHAHIRRSRELGINEDELEHVALLAMTTLGFPASVKAYTWIKDEQR